MYNRIKTKIFGSPDAVIRNESSRLDEYDYELAAERLDCHIAAVKAVAEVESRGDGFFPDGRPKILFERHIFSRLTHRNWDHVAGYENIANRTPGGYSSGAREYFRLETACRLDPIAGLKSASWGRFQIMGFNYRACGYKSVEDFVWEMIESEKNHLKAFVNLIKSWNLDVTLQRRQWSRFAKRYNGPAYKKNAYHTKLAGAYEKHLWKHSINTVRDLQRTLNELGFDCGIVDGLHGPKTAAAIMRFEFKARLPGVGKPTEKIMAAVQAVREFADE